MDDDGRMYLAELKPEALARMMDPTQRQEPDVWTDWTEPMTPEAALARMMRSGSGADT